jgi:Zn-dependent peptidase ImmA (M78 family)/DNA-binding XRE family transcriptional regulator
MANVISIDERKEIAKTQAFNGQRVREARLYRGINQKEFAEFLGVKRQTVKAYEENDLSSMGRETFNRMVEILDFPKEFFVEADNYELKTGTIFFRSLLTAKNQYKEEQAVKLAFIAKVISYVNSYLSFPKFDFPKYDESLTPEQAAQKLREHWNLKEKPIKDIVYLVEDKGIIVNAFDSSTGDIDAYNQLITYGEEEIHVIGYSKNKTSAARIHFDIAHELGHMMLHNPHIKIDKDDDKEYFKEMEAEAHDFAGAFLLPAEAFKKDVMGFADNLSHYVFLKKKWRVSISAMIRRSYNLELIDYKTYQNLMRKMQKQGIRKIEPLDDELYTAEPTLLKTAIKMLLDEVLTPEEFMDELSNEYNFTISHREIESLLDLPKDLLKSNQEAKVHIFQKK